MALTYPTEISQARLAAAVAATRFGYGARPGEIDWIADDPAGWLIRQLDGAGESLPPELQGLPSSAEIWAEMSAALTEGGAALIAFRQKTEQARWDEASRHILPAARGDAPFRERLVRFWVEFFGVGARDPIAGPFAHAFEREVIRPNLMRRYYDMLLAAVRHPAILLTTRNTASLAKRSPAGRDRTGDLRLDLAERILGPYAFGAVGGAGVGPGRDRVYGGPDVRALAAMLTGWGVRPVGEGPETAPAVERAPALPPAFRFTPQVHAEGPKYFLGRTYPEAGVLEAEAALDALTRTPAVGRRLAFEMARWFVADDPPAALVDDLTAGYARNGGALGGMAAALAASNAAYEPSSRKLKRPDDLALSVLRAFADRSTDGASVVGAIAALGQEPMDFEGPLGAPTSANHWLEPGRFLDRFEWAAGEAVRRLAGDSSGPEVGIRLGFDVLGPLLSEQTFRRLAVALDAGESAALLFVSPEFQTR